jgi:hypothetical protein
MTTDRECCRTSGISNPDEGRLLMVKMGGYFTMSVLPFR